MQKLTKAEEEIMQALWNMGSGTVGDVRNWLETHIKTDKPAHSTVSTMLRIMSEKGFIAYKVHGKTFEYSPLVSKEEYSRQSLDLMVNDYFAGSAAGLVSFLVREERLSEQDIANLKKLLDGK
jgi:BlaI family transcriptional regulator, penicillinase repressor